MKDEDKKDSDSDPEAADDFLDIELTEEEKRLEMMEKK
jgi:hypothetical protein